MQLSEKAITSFILLYKQKCGVLLNNQQAQVKALQALKQFATIYKTTSKDNRDLRNEMKTGVK